MLRGSPLEPHARLSQDLLKQGTRINLLYPKSTLSARGRKVRRVLALDLPRMAFGQSTKLGQLLNLLSFVHGWSLGNAFAKDSFLILRGDENFCPVAEKRRKSGHQCINLLELGFSRRVNCSIGALAGQLVSRRIQMPTPHF